MKHSASDIANDCVAGLVVGVLAIPKGLSLAAMAGLPPVNGLYASLFATIPYFFIGTSPIVVVGPTAVLSLMTRGLVPKNLEEASQEWIAFATALAFFSGLVQVAMGMMGFGVLIQLISEPVMQGFISASAVLIILSQVPGMLGSPKCDASITHGKGHEHDECFLVEYLVSFYRHFDAIHSTTAVLSAAAILLLVGFPLVTKRKWPRVSKFGSIVVLLIAAGAFSYLAHEYGTETDSKGHLLDKKTGVALMGEIPTGLPLPPTSPFTHFDFGDFKQMFMGATIMAIVGFMETSAISSLSKRSDKETSRTSKIIPKRELVALGASNLLCSITKGYPVCASFGRTAVNAECGAKIHQLSSLVSSLVVLLVLMVFSVQVKYIPNFALAVIVAQSVTGLIDVNRPMFLYYTNRVDFVTFSVTFLVTVGLGFEVGLGTGVLVNWSATLINFLPMRVELRRKSLVASTFVDATRSNLACDLAIIQLQTSLQFRTSAPLEQAFEDVCELFHPQCVIIDLSQSETLDVMGLEALQHLHEQCQQTLEVPHLVIVGLAGDARRVVERALLGGSELLWNLAPLVSGHGAKPGSLLGFDSLDDALGYLYGKIEPRQEAVVLGNEAFDLMDEASVSKWRQGGNQSDVDPGCRLPSFAREHTFELAAATTSEGDA
ncbi:hypothetical protein BASA81_000177 [Batrachochytrium salamandrivorans]|nr:hypothetical protein BASA81_000177 [Batrachochytrium salamandrivorans]